VFAWSCGEFPVEFSTRLVRRGRRVEIDEPAAFAAANRAKREAVSRAWDHRAGKDAVAPGDALEVAYLARKIHGKFQPVEYYHEFGEVDGTLPRLAYDKLRKQIFFIGGNYWVDVNMPAPGTPLGKISPGIEN
jgi:hypothetical protein